MPKKSLQAIILAGGAGTRLGDLTSTIPKPMLEVNGKPFLQYIIELLQRNGIKKIVLAIGYLANCFVDYFGTGEKYNVSIQYSIEKDFMGTGGALFLAKDLLDDNFFVVNGDTYLDIDYQKAYESFLKAKKQGMLVVYDNKDKIASNNIAINGETIIAYAKKEVLKRGEKVVDVPVVFSEKELEYIDAGVQVFKKSILDYIPGKKFVTLETEIFPILIKANQLKAFVTEQRYYDMGTPERFAQVKKVLG